MKTIITALVLFSVFGLDAQSKIKGKDKPLFNNADFAFYQGDDNTVIRIFSEMIKHYPDNATLVYEYGASMLNLGLDNQKAEEYLSKAIKLGKKEALFYYGKALHKNEKLDEALRVFQSYRLLSKPERTEDEVYDQVATIHQALKLMKTPVDVTITNLGENVNTDQQEYTPIVSGDSKNLYFTSRREGGLKDMEDPNQLYFEDIFYTNRTDSLWNKATRLDSVINTDMHDATVALSADGNTMIIYRTNKNLTGGDLYITNKKDNKWTIPLLMNENINSKYQEASACLSHDGQVMYFVSNRPEGMGGKDIYMVRLLPNKEWSKAKNLGPIINTPKDEDSPTLNRTNTILYFSSNGHITMGGYDIFKSEKVLDDWARPTNMGYPINTVNDELYLALDDTELRGYYSSDKADGFGLHDIYQIDMIYRESKDLIVKGIIVDENNNPLKATITAYNQDDDEKLGTYLANALTGKYVMALHPFIKYKIVIEAEGYSKQEDFLYYDKLSFNLLEYDIEMLQLNPK